MTRTLYQCILLLAVFVGLVFSRPVLAIEVNTNESNYTVDESLGEEIERLEVSEEEPVVSVIETKSLTNSIADSSSTVSVENINMQDLDAVAAEAKEAPEISTVVPPLVVEGGIVISSVMTSETRGFDSLELYNYSSDIFDMSRLEIIFLYSDENTDYECIMQSDGYLLSHKYVSFTHQALGETGAYLMSSCDLPESNVFSREVQLVYDSKIIERLSIPEEEPTDGFWERRGLTSSYRKGVFVKDFRDADLDRGLLGDDLYYPKEEIKLEILSILLRPEGCSSDDNSLECRPYLKVKNSGKSEVNLANFRMRAGKVGEKSTSSNTSYLSGKISSNEVAIIYQDVEGQNLALGLSSGTVWFEDFYGLKTYKNNVTPFENAGYAKNRGRVWALKKDNSWAYGMPNPSGEQNVFVEERVVTTEEKTCPSGYYLKTSTNRCNKIKTQSSSATCPTGQVRNSTTNRCRKVSTSSSALTPCRDGYERNPLTNRCKKISTSKISSLVPCKEGYERNAETNRCRKIVNNTTELVMENPITHDDFVNTANSGYGWWIFGGLASLAGGRAFWEWRTELVNLIRKLPWIGGIK